MFRPTGSLSLCWFQKFVGIEQKATAFGRLLLFTLMVGLLVQSLAGMLSDNSALRWEHRHPLSLIGTLPNMACLVTIRSSPGYWCLFSAAVFSQTASNSGQGAEQGPIPRSRASSKAQIEISK